MSMQHLKSDEACRVSFTLNKVGTRRTSWNNVIRRVMRPLSRRAVSTVQLRNYFPCGDV